MSVVDRSRRDSKASAKTSTWLDKLRERHIPSLCFLIAFLRGNSTKILSCTTNEIEARKQQMRSLGAFPSRSERGRSGYERHHFGAKQLPANASQPQCKLDA